jgi:uncharacterized protein with HEPN domain
VGRGHSLGRGRNPRRYSRHGRRGVLCETSNRKISAYSIAVIREAAKNISPEFKAAHPDIPWRAIAGTRDRIVHEYFRTNTRRIWYVVADEIDALENALRRP